MKALKVEVVRSSSPAEDGACKSEETRAKGIPHSGVKAGDREGWRHPGHLQAHLGGQLFQSGFSRLPPAYSCGAGKTRRSMLSLPTPLMLLCRPRLASSTSNIHCV